MADGDPEAGKTEAEPDAPDDSPEDVGEGAGEGTGESAGEGTGEGEGPTEEHVESLTGAPAKDDPAKDDPGKDDPDQNRMTMMEHLAELRRRLMWCVVALLVAFGVCVFFASEIFDFLSRPLMDILRARNEDATLIYTKLYEVFFTEIKIGFYAAAFLAFPIFAVQLWKFVAPGLYSKEKSAFRPFLIATPLLFFAGGAMVYYAIMPLAWEFFAAFQNTGETGSRIELLPKVEEYLSLVIKLIFAFGIAFQLPVVLTLLAKVDLVTSKGLAKFRKYAVVMVFVFAAILTPPDVISQIGLAIPILLLYEVSIFLARMIEKKRAEEDAALQAELAE